MSFVDNSLLIRALQRKPVTRPPIWLMRQAGRYLPEYRQTRAQAGDFLSLCKNKELACEVTLQPLRRFALDAAILFSDILTIPDAMGLGVYFAEGEGPGFERPLHTVEDMDKIIVPSINETLQYVLDAVSLIRHEMPKDMPLIGFSGSPWTLACYMIEGKSSRDYKRILKCMYQEPQALHRLLTKLATAVSNYLSEQAKAGVNALMIFDTWGGILSTHNYQDFSLHYMALIVKQLKQKHPHVPITLFTKGGGQWLTRIADSGCDAIGVDWTCDLGDARREVGQRVALQGNLDPTVLLTTPACIRREVHRVLDSYGTGNGLIFNLGHGITPDVPPDNVTALIDAVHDYQGGA